MQTRLEAVKAQVQAALDQAMASLPEGDLADAMRYACVGGKRVRALLVLESARLHGLDRVRGLFLRLDRPLDFDAVDRQPVDLVFALLASASGGVDHLKALALVSRTIRNPELRDRLRANADPVALHALLASGTATKAA